MTRIPITEDEAYDQFMQQELDDRVFGPVERNDMRANGYMRCYASNTGTKRNLEQFRRHGWRVLLTPQNPKWPDGLHCGIDNGAWPAFVNNLPFDGDGFMRVVERNGPAADWVVIPDKVAEGLKSLEFSEGWMPKLRGLKLLLLAVQDGMEPHHVSAFMRRYPTQAIGIFLGGSTEWKLKTMYSWGMVADALGVYYHVARVNSAKRIRLAQEAGADSIDGTSGTLYSITVPRLDAAARQGHLLSPRTQMA